MYIYIYIYIYIHVFCPSQDSSVWLGLTSRESREHTYIYTIYKCPAVFFEYLIKVLIVPHLTTFPPKITVLPPVLFLKIMT